MGLDFNNGVVYCGSCSNYVYDVAVDSIIQSERYRMDTLISRIRTGIVKPMRAAWTLNQEQMNMILENTRLIKCPGLRGLQNMGSTCFLNSILQTFLHNPVLTTHFLSEGHPSSICSIANCLACEVDRLYSNCYSGEIKPYAPTSFLHSMWRSQKHLAGYAQQDAHEFMISVLNEMHLNLNGHVQSCDCIVHKVFGGLLQSDVTCLKCSNVTTTTDPIIDLSLEMKPIKKKGREGVPHSLSDCLETFMTPEKLDANQYSCTSCGNTFQEATKQLSILKLPSILSIQLKRFEQASSTSFNKIDMHIKIPEVLDMSPYTTRSTKLKSKVKKLKGIQGFDTLIDRHPLCSYSLFAIVHHEGKLDTGHYKTFAKHQDDWYLFDDHRVTLSSLKDAVQCNAYMCFYIRDHAEVDLTPVSLKEDHVFAVPDPMSMSFEEPDI